jgi:glycosyltransferase involved in cell wall biosynthesis
MSSGKARVPTIKRKALVLSYSPVARDPRVRRQIQWLVLAGFEVHVWGLGPAPCVGEHRYDEISFPPPVVRLATYLFSSSKRRSAIFVGAQLAHLAQVQSEAQRFEIVLLNDLDFLGLDDLFDVWEATGTRVVIDLHEYFFDVGGSRTWRLFHVRYYRWLLKKLTIRRMHRYLTVSEEISALYETKLQQPLVSIENTPDSLRVSDVLKRSSEIKDGQRVQLVHHGIYGRGRGIPRLIQAMRKVDSRFELNLMLIMSARARLSLITLAHILGVRGRVKFLDPVPIGDLLNELSRFDVEVVFFHPPNSKSVHYSLPNKLFEALAAGLALVVGANPSMAQLVHRYNLGRVVKDWKASSLAHAINDLTPESINEFKNNSFLPLEDYSDARLRRKFIGSLE